MPTYLKYIGAYVYVANIAHGQKHQANQYAFQNLSLTFYTPSLNLKFLNPSVPPNNITTDTGYNNVIYIKVFRKFSCIITFFDDPHNG